MKLLEVDGLSLHFGRQEILKDLSFSFDKGKITGLLGPNGAGKSSIMKILAGLVYPESGTWSMGGKPHTNFSELREYCSFMIEAPAFYPFLSGRQNLELVCKILGLRVDLKELMNTVGLEYTSAKRVKNYSSGMKQRLAIAQVMIKDSDLLILDEPFNGLDPNGFQELILILKELSSRGKTIVVSSHLLNELEQFADGFILLHQGSIAMDITKESLIRSKKKVVFDFETKLSAEAKSYLEGKGSVEDSELRALLELDPGEISQVVQRLVTLNAVPVNVDTKNVLQEKYLEIAV